MHQVVGLGTDIVRILRFRKILAARGLASLFVARLGARILEPLAELPLFKRYVDLGNIDKTASFLAGSWAVKEALFKALDVADQRKFEFRKWAKLNDSNGRPFVSGTNSLNDKFMVTVSHDEDILVATVLRQAVAS